MQIKLLKTAQWGGKSYKSGTVHDVDALIGDKLVDRDLAEVHIPSEVKDAPTADE